MAHMLDGRGGERALLLQVLLLVQIRIFFEYCPDLLRGCIVLCNSVLKIRQPDGYKVGVMTS